MSQRAAWQLERHGVADVHDFVHGKAYWIASGRPTVRSGIDDRVLGHVVDPPEVSPDASITEAAAALAAGGHGLVVVLGEGRIVLGMARAGDLDGAGPDHAVEDAMRVGPTTIRPDESLDAVQARMRKRNVPSVIVTKPTGELIGLLLADESPT